MTIRPINRQNPFPLVNSAPANGVPQPEMNALDQLFHALQTAEIPFCHWKSNVRLPDALAGKTDLDLLVDPAHKLSFRQILRNQQIAPLRAAPGKDYPGIENHLGFDPANGRLFHLHVHYQLVLGEQFVKNYRLPLMDTIFNHLETRAGVPVPAPALELIILSTRALLKYRDRDGYKDILTVRKPGVPGHIRAELEWLRERTTAEEIKRMFQEIAAIIPPAIILDFWETLQRAPRDGRRLLRLRARLRRALRTYQVHPRPVARFRYFRESWRRRKTFLKFTPRGRMTPIAGGNTIAFIGVDGAGKSTMSTMIAGWLSWKLDTRRTYMGSKQPSPRSRAIYLLFRLTRRGTGLLHRRFSDDTLWIKALSHLQHTMLNLHQLSLAFDRYRRFRAGEKQAARGVQVIYDRFPIAPLLDGPKIGQSGPPQSGTVGRLLARWEQYLYRRIHSPDYTFILLVPPGISLQRKPDHDPQAIAAKHEALRNWQQRSAADQARPQVHGIDAAQNSAAVEKVLKTAVWKAIYRSGENDR